MKNIPAIILLLIISALPAPGRSMVRIAGNVPPGITAERLDREFQRVCRQVSQRHGCGRSPVKVIFYRERTQPLLAYRLPEWGGGGALGPDSAIIAVDRPFALNYDFERIAVHELVHIAIIRASRGAQIPRWFHEGVAMTLAGEISFEEQSALARALLAGRMIALSAIDTVNAVSRSTAALAYSQSHASVIALIETYGIEIIALLVDASAQSGDFALGVQAVLGLTLEELELFIAQKLRSRYGMAFIFGDLMYIWIIVLALAFAAYFAVRHRKNIKRAAMALEESAARETNAETEPFAQPLSPTPTPPLAAHPLPANTELAADILFEWAKTWRFHPEEPDSPVRAVWLYGACLEIGATRPPLTIVIEFVETGDDEDEEETFERLYPVWLDSIRDSLGELAESFARVDVFPCFSDDDKLFAELERAGLLLFERE